MSRRQLEGESTVPIKCDTCRHCVLVEVPKFQFSPGTIPGTLQHVAVCKNELCTTEQIREMFPERHGMPLDMAREICNREGDGIFVHFEPKTPKAGAAFGESRSEFDLDRLGQTGQDNAAATRSMAAGGANA